MKDLQHHRGRLAVWARFLAAYARANLQGALEYRASFISQVVAMTLNDAMWLVFWLAYFDKFRVVEGWGRAEIVTLWAVVAASFGLATTFCGNLFRLAGMIVRGELDIYLALEDFIESTQVCKLMEDLRAMINHDRKASRSPEPRISTELIHI